jgi:hypothetical protein
LCGTFEYDNQKWSKNNVLKYGVFDVFCSEPLEGDSVTVMLDVSQTAENSLIVCDILPLGPWPTLSGWELNPLDPSAEE